MTFQNSKDTLTPTQELETAILKTIEASKLFRKQVGVVNLLGANWFHFLIYPALLCYALTAYFW